MERVYLERGGFLSYVKQISVDEIEEKEEERGWQEPPQRPFFHEAFHSDWSVNFIRSSSRPANDNRFDLIPSNTAVAIALGQRVLSLVEKL